MSYHNLVTFNNLQHANYDEACKHGETYCTPSTVDALSCRSGMYDIEEVCRTLFDAAGLENDFAVGVVADNGEFVTLDAITTKMGEDEFCNAEPDEVINQLADLQKYAGDQRAMALDSMGQSSDAYNCIGISTAHLSEQAMDDLTTLAETEMAFARDTGWFLKLYDDVESNDTMMRNACDELQNIVTLANLSEYRMIEFDSDAAYYDGLPKFDNETPESAKVKTVHFEAGQHIPEPVQKDLVSDQAIELELDKPGAVAWDVARKIRDSFKEVGGVVQDYDTNGNPWPVILLSNDGIETSLLINQPASDLTQIVLTLRYGKFTNKVKIPVVHFSRISLATKIAELTGLKIRTGSDV